MPSYRFTIHGGAAPPDHVCEPFPDLPTACREAVLLLGHILEEDPGALVPDGRLQVRVSDEAGAPLFELSLTASAWR